jgi:hypothetical protein
VVFLLKLGLKILINVTEVLNLDNITNNKLPSSTKYLYASVVLTFFIIVYSGIIFVYDSYRPNELVPYPTNEDCILNFDLAIINPTTMKFFYDYLENID